MSGDVQPRKRKDKKKKKEEIGVEETRGTAAVFGEGDVFIHSQHDHGTGGHWCAKIIFFSLLAVLITLIGLIILENRGLSELEANAVESRYSGVLEGWLEDIPDDDHHDDHTLELNSPDDDIQEERHEVEEDVGENAITSQELDDSGELSQEEYEYDVDSEEEEDPTYTETTYEVNSNNYEAESSENKQDEEYYYFRQQTGSNKKEYNTDENNSGKRYSEDEDYEHFDDNKYDADVLNKNDVSEEINSFEDTENFMSNNNNESKETQIENDDNDDDHDAFHEDIELERLEMENNEDEKSISTELPALLEDDDEDKSADVSTEIQSVNEDDIDEEEYLEADDFDESPEQLISASAGKPLVEMEEEASSEKPPNTLNEEEEYELRQQELRREEEQSSNNVQEEPLLREETPLTDRRMTLITEESIISANAVLNEIATSKLQSSLETVLPPAKSILFEQESEDEDDDNDVDEEKTKDIINPTDNKELYSDNELEDEEIVPKTIAQVTQPNTESTTKSIVQPELDDEDPDDVEIIDEEQLEEELMEEDEEDISDVDDAELLSRLEAKYGKLPEPERPKQTHKDGGNSIEDDWPGEPNDVFWRQQINSAERELDQDWFD